MDITPSFPRLYSTGGEVCPDEVHEMWRQKRRWHLEQHPHCQRCLEAGKTVAASVATHVKPLRGNVDVRTFLNSEVHSLCAGCNRKVSANVWQDHMEPTVAAKVRPSDPPRH